MNAVVASGMGQRRLRALGITPLRLRDAPRGDGQRKQTPSYASGESGPAAMPVPPGRICRLALLADAGERRDPAIDRMYTALTEAVAKAGLQSVRVCDVTDDPTAALMVFGTVSPPPGVPADRVLHVDALSALHADRERKRALWERMQALGRGPEG